MKAIGRHHALLALAAAIMAVLPCGTAMATEGEIEVTFNLNGVAGDVYTVSGPAPLEIPEVEVNFGEDYKLLGWATKRVNPDKVLHPGDVVEIDTVLYAQWESGFHEIVGHGGLPETPLDLTRLDAAMDAARKAISEITWASEASVSKLEEKLHSVGVSLAAGSLTQKDVDKLANEVKRATEQFVSEAGEKPGPGEKPKPADKTALAAALDKASKIDRDGVDKALLDALDKAVDKAEAVKSDPDATQDAVDAAMKAVKDAMKAIEDAGGQKPEPTNKTALAAALDKASKIDRDGVDKALLDALDKAVEKAEAVKGDPYATQDAVDKATRALIDAIDAIARADATGGIPQTGDMSPVAIASTAMCSLAALVAALGLKNRNEEARE